MKIFLVIFTLASVQVTKLGDFIICDSRQKIVIVDEGLDLTDDLSHKLCTDSIPAINNTNIVIDHGRNIISLISPGVDFSKYCIYYISVNFSESGSYRSAIDLAKSLKNVVLVNLSIANQINDKNAYIVEEHELFIEFANKSIIINAAAGNSNLSLTKANCHIYPACLKHLVKSKYIRVIENSGAKSNRFVDIDRIIIDGVNKGKPILSGSSQSTAIQSNLDILKLQRKK